MGKFYAVKVGRKPGVYQTWNECKEQIDKYPNSIFKAFNSEVEALNFIEKKEIKQDNNFIVYTDGSCSNYIGGWAIVIIKDKEIKEYKGHLPECTNNIAELSSIYQSLLILENEDNFVIRSDSLYSINSLTIWGDNWEKNNWRKVDGKVPENLELIKEIRLLLKNKNIKFEHIYGHNGEQYNERVNTLANEARLLLNN